MNFNRINKLINDFMLNDPFFSRNNNFFNDYTKKTYKSDDGSFVFTVMTNNGNIEEECDEILNLKYQLDLAVDKQDFEKAVELRDKIKNLEKNKEELDSLKLELNECIETQDFETAIKLRDKINSLK